MLALSMKRLAALEPIYTARVTMHIIYEGSAGRLGIEVIADAGCLYSN